MRNIIVKVHPSKSNLKKKDQLAWKIAEIASDKSKINKDAAEMVINRIIDNASVAIASFNRKPVISARQMALAHPNKNGARKINNIKGTIIVPISSICLIGEKDTRPKSFAV